MIKSFLKVAIRNIGRQKLYHSINFIGLSVGLTCCALVLLYSKHEFSYDHFHHESENTYRFAGKRVYGPWIPSLELQYTHELMKNPLPGMDHYVRIRRTPSRYSVVDDQKFNTNKTLILEPGSQFFEIFDFEILKGNPESIAEEPFSAIITNSLAQKYFGERDPMGATFKYDTLLVQVTGILEDLPSNTHLQFEQLIVHPSYLSSERGGAIFYATLNKGTDPSEIAKKIQQMNLGLNEFDSLSAVLAQPIERIHLNSKMTFELKPGGNKSQLLIFSIIALIILLISITNYTNLSSALYSKRSGEIAMRKVLGSTKRQLSFQFLTESILVASLCLPFVILLIEAVLPPFSNFIGIQLQNRFISDFNYAFILILITILTGAFAGIYPSVVLPHLKVLNLLKKDGQSMKGGLLIRRIMITGQFTLLIGLGSMAYITNKQLQFLANKELGFNAEGVIKLKQAWGLQGTEKIKSLKSKLMENPSIIRVSQGYVPGDEDYTMSYRPEEAEVIYSDALSAGVDFDYFETLSIKGLYGPYFEEQRDEHPRTSLLVNEKFVQKFGWDNPLGKRITTRPNSPEPTYYEIRGVFNDYNFFSLHQEVTPMIIFARDDREYVNQNILVKVNTANIKNTLDYISSVWDQFVPDSPVKYELMDVDIKKAYSNDAHTAKLSVILSSLAIGLAILGLIGLTAYIAELKIKEVGIRKVLGASVFNLLLIFNREFVSSLLIATVLAGLFGYYLISKWLEGFAYRIDLQLFIFLLAGILVFAVTITTVSIQSVKTAMQNPIKALRHE